MSLWLLARTEAFNALEQGEGVLSGTSVSCAACVWLDQPDATMHTPPQWFACVVPSACPPWLLCRNVFYGTWSSSWLWSSPSGIDDGRADGSTLVWRHVSIACAITWAVAAAVSNLNLRRA